MAARTTEDEILTHLAVTAAKSFVTSYYKTLSHSRSTITTHYQPSPVSISFIGNPITTREEFQTMYLQMPTTTFEVQSYDAQPLVPNGKGQCSILLLTNGYVKLGEEKDAPLRGFTESFVLEPVEDGGKVDWRIRNQSFRIVF